MGAIIEILNRKSVELKSESVELGALADLKKLSTKANKAWDEASSLEAKLTAMANDAISRYKEARVLSNQISKGVDSLEKQAKSLDLELPANAKQLKESADNYISKGETKIKSLQSIRK